mmetsp:Transcript_72393/g.186737  ORF Transcript_72393/g.186737 Transcript_72393/m.186737 type:complete len:569 (-) Transcript_72393:1851-3557(-)
MVICLHILHEREHVVRTHGTRRAATFLLVLRVRLLVRDVRDLGLGQLAPEQHVPVKALEEVVLPQELVAFQPGTLPLGRIASQQTPDQGHHFLGVRLLHEPAREAQLRAQDLLEDLGVVRRIVGKGELAHNKLVEADAQTPQVGAGAVALSLDHLRGHEHRSALDHVAPRARDALRDAEVDDLHVALLIDEAVLTLQVQVRDPPGVQELEGQEDGGRVELRLRPVQQAEHVQHVQQLAAAHQLLQEVDLGPPVEGAHKLDDEGMVDLCQDAALGDEGLLLPPLHHVPLPDALEGVPHASLPCADHRHDAEAAAAHDAQVLEVVKCQLRVLQVDARLQVLEAGPLHRLLEGRLVNLPQLCRLRGSDGRGALGVLQQQGALAEVVVDAQRPHHPPVDVHLQLASPDDVEVRARLALREDALALHAGLDLQRPGQPVELVLRQRAEYDRGLQDADLVILLQRLIQVVEGQDVVQVLAAPDRQLRLLAAFRCAHAEVPGPVTPQQAFLAERAPRVARDALDLRREIISTPRLDLAVQAGHEAQVLLLELVARLQRADLAAAGDPLALLLVQP